MRVQNRIDPVQAARGIAVLAEAWDFHHQDEDAAVRQGIALAVSFYPRQFRSFLREAAKLRSFLDTKLEHGQRAYVAGDEFAACVGSTDPLKVECLANLSGLYRSDDGDDTFEQPGGKALVRVSFLKDEEDE